jgi:hypothetical protein
MNQTIFGGTAYAPMGALIHALETITVMITIMTIIVMITIMTLSAGLFPSLCRWGSNEGGQGVGAIVLHLETEGRNDFLELRATETESELRSVCVG